MTKWVENKEVKLNSQRDIYAYLSSSENVAVRRYNTGSIIKFNKEGFLSLAKDENHYVHWYFNDPDSFTAMKRAEWHEDIPENGVIGKAWDNNENNALITVCTSYEEEIEYKFRSARLQCGYKNFRPFTKEEVMQYILEP